MPDTRLQLFLFPYAGGSAASFKRLTNLIDDQIETITVEYAGRGTRSREPFASSIWAMLDDAAAYCRQRRDEKLPYAFMGYSMGSILAYEAVRRKVFPENPRHLFICAEVSPKCRALDLERAGEPTKNQILDRAKQLGGLNVQMLQNKRFADIYIKPMLADYSIFYQYRFNRHNAKIDTDTTFFYCGKDTAQADVRKWSELIGGKLDYYELGEDHFFINRHYRQMAEVINRTLRPSRGNEYDI